MIARIWHGYTTSENADGYEKLLQNEILPDIERVHRHEAQLLRRNLPGQSEVEFITICYFENLDEVRAFAWDDYEKCVVPEVFNPKFVPSTYWGARRTPRRRV